jgi:hypothetical protein
LYFNPLTSPFAARFCAASKCGNFLQEESLYFKLPILEQRSTSTKKFFEKSALYFCDNLDCLLGYKSKHVVERKIPPLTRDIPIQVEDGIQLSPQEQKRLRRNGVNFFFQDA